MIRASTSTPARDCSRQYVTACLEQANVVRRWPRMASSHSSTVMLTNIRSRRMPALFTRVSSRPNASRASATSDPAPSQSAASAWLATASPPSPRISSATASATQASDPLPWTSPPVSLTTTRAPWRANSRAWARPSPRPAPVTMTTRPSQIPFMKGPFRRRRAGCSGQPGGVAGRVEILVEPGDEPVLAHLGHHAGGEVAHAAVRPAEPDDVLFAEPVLVHHAARAEILPGPHPLADGAQAGHGVDEQAER